jgi:hypothetical protein
MNICRIKNKFYICNCIKGLAYEFNKFLFDNTALTGILKPPKVATARPCFLSGFCLWGLLHILDGRLDKNTPAYKRSLDMEVRSPA